MSHYNLHSENSYGTVSRFKAAKSLDDGVASVWGGATTISSDSGVSSCGEGLWPCPDLLECDSVQDFEEKINQIVAGNVKKSESVCYKNLLNLLKIQQLQLGAETKSTTMKRAIVGSRDVEKENSTKVQPPSNTSYHGDLHCLSALLDQDVPLAFPGEVSVNMKYPPPNHPPVVGNSNLASCQFSSSQQVYSPSLAQPGASKVFLPSMSSIGLNGLISNTPRMSLHNLAKLDGSHNIKFCIDEAHYQLMSLIRERSKIEMIRFQSSDMVETVQEERKGRPRSIKALLYEIDKEISNVKAVAKTFGQLGVDLTSACSALKSKIMASYGENEVNMSANLRKISKDMRRLRTILWSLSSCNVSH